MHKIYMSAPLVDALVRLDQKHNGIADVNEMDLAPDVYANFASMRFFDLIEPICREDGTRRRGRWAITKIGYDFIDGLRPVRMACWRGDGSGQRVRWEVDAPEKYLSQILSPLTHPDPVSPIW
jgi:hypothetical protein